MSFNRRARRLPSDQGWKKISRHFSHLSTNISLDKAEEEEEDSQVLRTFGSHRSDPSQSPTPAPTPKILRLRFKIHAVTKLGCSIGLVGNRPELGAWNLDHKLTLTTRQGQYPMWTSEEVVIFVHAQVYTAEYKYIIIESVNLTQNGSCSWEKRIANRKLEVRFPFCGRISWTIVDSYESVGPAVTVVDVKQHLPLLTELNEENSLFEHLQAACSYFEKKAAEASLQDYLSLCYLFQHWTESGLETESKQCLDLLLRLTETLLNYSTDEIEPVIREVLGGMARCSVPFWKLTRSIVDRALVEAGRVPLGCHSTEVFEFVTDFLNVSQSSEESLARAIILNSIRRCLRRMRDRSSTPDLLILYDICLEEIALTFITTHCPKPGSESLLTLVHRMSIILEFLELSNVCAKDCGTYNRTLEAVWHTNEATASSLESIKSVFLDLLRTFILWRAKYANTEALGENDPVNLRELLREVSERYTKMLFPTLAEALRMVDAALGLPLYLPLRTGTAVGKVAAVENPADIPQAYSSVILLLSQVPDSFDSLPPAVKAVIIQQEVPFDSKLLAACSEKNIPLAVAAKERLPEHVYNCVEVRVFEDSLDFV